MSLSFILQIGIKPFRMKRNKNIKYTKRALHRRERRRIKQNIEHSPEYKKFFGYYF
mgnify:CR=1 FL=1